MISIGELLDDKYLVTRKLGTGGFGDVFLAGDEAIPARHVAIKVLTRPPEGDHGNLLWEMRTLAQFNHRHVVTFYHHFADDDGLYLVMEFCPGGSLDDRLAASGFCSVEQTFAWGVDLCDTLAFVHGQGIVHHDIKPHNILFAADGTIKLGDFGIANRNTGTLLYMPPEMLLGERVSRTDARVDVYALGLTLLETLTGRHPFEDLRRDEALQARIAHDFIPVDLPRWTQEVLLKATHPTPELRFQTAQDFAEAIRHRHVPYLVDGQRIKADSLARQAEVAIRSRQWRKAERLAAYALETSPDSIPALLAAGRCQLAIRRTDRAREYFSRAVSVSPRTQVQKELGWINLEQGRLPTAISLLADHLQRNASDYEAYSLLLKCFYLSDRFEVAQSLARTLMAEKPPNDSFYSNLLLCCLLGADSAPDELESLRKAENPFIRHNVHVATEHPSAWAPGATPSLKSKLLFEEYRFAEARRAGRVNSVVVHGPGGSRHSIDLPIVSIGSLESNDIVIRHRTVSRRHCAIVNYPGDVWLYDLESTTGTVVDGQRVGGRVFIDGLHDVAIGEVCIRVAASSSLLI